MLHASIFVELLRARPALAVWLAAALQAALWTLVPTAFFSSPPGNVPAVLAIGHEFQLHSSLGPPLSFWLAEIAFDLTGSSLLGVYALSQVCVWVTYWAVFRLGSAIVGAQHAVLAVLLMVGIASFTVPTPDFGPAILTMPLWAMALLHYWRLVIEGRAGYRYALAVEIALILLTSIAGLLLVGLLALFTLAHHSARAKLTLSSAWPAALALGIALVPHLYLIAHMQDEPSHVLERLRSGDAVVGNLRSWLRQVGLVLGAHAGLVALVGLTIGWPWAKPDSAPVLSRPSIEPLSRRFVYFFAGMPALFATFAAVILGQSGPLGGLAPLVVLSGLAVIVAAGDAVALTHQRVVVAAWFGLLLLPPAMAVIALLIAPWIGIDLTLNQPAGAIGRFYADSFQRRVGVPLPIVSGDTRFAELIGLAAPSRPKVLFADNPERSPWTSMADVAARGAIVVWPAADTVGAPPAAIAEMFPGIVPEVPRGFERPIEGRLGLLRIGWALIRPQAAQNPPAVVATPR
jgi:hypothetical protein